MKKLLALFLCFNIIFLTGCWDTREINELGLVMAVGVDRKKGSNIFTVTVQIAKPTDAAGAGGKGGGGSDPVWVGTAEGKTIFEAIRNIAKFASRRIMWAHNNIVIIGEDLARDDITPVMDFFTHNPELRMKTWVAISEGDARPYVEAKTGMENIPAMSIGQLFRYYYLPAESVQSDMLHVFADFKSDIRQPLVSRIVLKNNKANGTEKQIELSGAAIFKGPKMIGWVSPEETRGLAWIRKDIKNAIVNVSMTDDEKGMVAVEMEDVKLKITSKIEDKVPSMKISITAKGNITETDFTSSLPIEEFKVNVEHLVEKRVLSEVKLGLDKAQKEYKSDVLGLGRMIHIEHKDDWYGEIRDKWNDIYSQMQVDVDVNVDIDSNALYQDPIKLDKNKGGMKDEGKD